MLIALTIGAGFATWLIVFGMFGRDATASERREELLARVRGDHPDRSRARASAAPAARRSLFGRARPSLVLRGSQQGFVAGFEPTLRRAGISSPPRDFISTVLLIAALFGVAANAFVGVPGLVGGFFLGIGSAIFIIRSKTTSRARRINDQLVDLLQVVAGGLTAGQSFLQALASAAKEIGDPIGAELQLLMSEVELGATMEGALERLRDRVKDEDLSLVIDAVLIQRRVGGNLSEVLNNISGTIRERIRIRGEVKALTGQARMSGWLLSGLPIGMAIILYFMNPDYMAPLFFTRLGQVLVAGGLASEVFGFILMQKIANVKA